MTKTCKTCNEEKPLEDFYRHKKMLHGRQSSCKTCYKAKYAKESAREKKSKEERWNGYMGAEFANHRQCVDCDEVKDWKKFCLGSDKLQNLCRDCHRIRIKKEVDVAPVGNKKKDNTKSNMDDLLAFLNAT